MVETLKKRSTKRFTQTYSLSHLIDYTRTMTNTFFLRFFELLKIEGTY